MLSFGKPSFPDYKRYQLVYNNPSLSSVAVACMLAGLGAVQSMEIIMKAVGTNREVPLEPSLQRNSSWNSNTHIIKRNSSKGTLILSKGTLGNTHIKKELTGTLIKRNSLKGTLVLKGTNTNTHIIKRNTREHSYQKGTNRNTHQKEHSY